MEKNFSFDNQLKFTMLTIYIMAILGSFIFPLVFGIIGVVISFTESSRGSFLFLLCTGIFCCLYGIISVFMVSRLLIRLMKGAPAVTLTQSGISCVFPMGLKQHFIPWNIISEIELPEKEGKLNSLVLHFNPSLSKKQLKTVLSKGVLRGIKKNTLHIQNSTSLVDEDFFKIVKQCFSGVSLNDLPEPLVTHLDNWAYTKRNLKYNIGLMVATVIFIAALFIFDAVLQILKEKWHFLLWFFPAIVIALAIYSRRFDSLAPRELVLYPDKLVYTYVTFRSRTRRKTTAFEILKQDIEYAEFGKNKMVIHCYQKTPVALDHLEFSQNQWELLKKYLPNLK